VSPCRDSNSEPRSSSLLVATPAGLAGEKKENKEGNGTIGRIIGGHVGREGIKKNREHDK
jgi:hypothetical protein